MTEAADSKADVDRRIGLATGVAGNLAVIWRSKDIGLMTKTRLYKALVLSVLLYNAETWTMTKEIGRKLLVFEMAVLRRIAGISRWDRRRNVDIRRDTRSNGMSSTKYAPDDSRTLGMWSVCRQTASRTSCYMEE